MSKQPRNSRQLLVKILIVFTLFAFVVVPVATYPGKANAGLPTITIGDIPRQVYEMVKDAVTSAGKIAWKNASTMFFNNLAYNFATKLATGDAGQKPLFYNDSWRDTLKNAGDIAIGELSKEILKFTTEGKCKYETNRVCVRDADCQYMDQSSSSFYRTKEEAQNKGASPENIIKDTCELPASAKLGPIDICNFSLDPAVELQIKTTSIRAIGGTDVRPPKARCTYEGLKQQVKDLKNIKTSDLVKVSNLFNQQTNQIGVIWRINSAARTKVAYQTKAGELERLAGRGYKALKSKITKKNKTADGSVSDANSAITREAFKVPQFLGDPIADAFGVFATTFASKWFERQLNKGFDPESDPTVVQRSSIFARISGISAAKKKFSELLQADNFISNQRKGAELLQQLTICGSGSGDGLDLDAVMKTNNCVIDEGFRTAIEQKLTVKQALSQGYLDGQKDFGVHADGSGLTALSGASCGSSLCDPGVYSLRSIIILRKYRIVPVGWELAARYIAEQVQKNPAAPQRVFNLNYLTEAYFDVSSPFYGLVDPQWLLKAPIAYSETLGPGEGIQFENFIRDTDTDGNNKIDNFDEPTRIIQRATQITGEKTCIFENADGTCADNNFGYCTEEKPLWRIDGEPCNPKDPQDGKYASCQAYTRGGDGASVAYLRKTTRKVSLFGSTRATSCTSEVAGCRRYALTRDESDQWVLGGVDQTFGSGDIYLDRDAPKCSYEDVGCSEFLRLSVAEDRIISPDEVRSVISKVTSITNSDGIVVGGEINEYYTDPVVDVNKVYFKSDIARCEEKAVGCRMYSPKSFGGPDIPGIVTAGSYDEGGLFSYNDECPGSCVGYRPYTEESFGTLYPTSRTVNMIPSTANQCSAISEGCTEFTNLNEVALGGETSEYYTELRECITENDERAETFFTWEGSEDTGFQLRTWQLKAENNAPLPAESADCTASIYNLPPDDPSANPDCREYIGKDLTRYYRLHSKVIFASKECNQLRRTGSTDTYYAIPSLSRTCKQAEVGCRRYTGSDAGNTTVVLDDNFEDGGTSGWSATGGSNALVLRNSSESIRTGGKSLESGGARIESQISVVPNGVYVVEFWAKFAQNAQQVSVGISNSENSNGSSVDYIDIGLEWGRYTAGPFVISDSSSGSELVSFSTSNSTIFYDNIKVSASADKYLIRNSWTTPEECSSPEEQLFCEEYEDDNGNARYIKNFSSLCEEKFVGCEAVVNTFNSDWSNAIISDTTNNVAYDDVNVPADSIDFIVNDSRYKCEPAFAGCREVGEVTTSRDHTASNPSRTFDTQYRVVDPDLFVDSLCLPEQELCEEYTQVENSLYASEFKNPQDRVCEYLYGQSVVGRSSPVSGWFKVKLDSSPYEESDICQLSSETSPRISDNFRVCNYDYENGRFLDPETGGTSLTYPDVGCYTYSCPSEASTCQEFQDPLFPEGCDSSILDKDDPRSCDFYYLLKNTLNSGDSECLGIDPEEGCIGLFETDRGLDSRVFRADCQSGCELKQKCYNTSSYSFTDSSCLSDSDCNGNAGEVCRAVPVSPYPSCQEDTYQTNPNSKPGCVL